MEVKAELRELGYLGIFLCDLRAQRLEEDRRRFGLRIRDIGFGFRRVVDVGLEGADLGVGLFAPLNLPFRERQVCVGGLGQQNVLLGVDRVLEQTVNDDGIGAGQLLVLVDLIEGSPPAVGYYLQFQPLDIVAGGAVADLVDCELGDLIGEDPEEAHQFEDQVFRHLRPGQLWIVHESVEEDRIALQPDEMQRQLDFLEKRGDQLSDDDLAVCDLFFVGEDEPRVAGDVCDEEDHLSLDRIHAGRTSAGRR